ncbi:hypothetical protein ANN_17933 [Periplaneta americana]|uniref:PiggyBac transposable element-derived protein domain-containing protein n=1 Tax=Periplaneta americana TaxID=6978 RepID=A0ABQ8SMU5_PERAM|nr:hypothetical protein ANN_17933 [Periplaneta americana]
MNSKPDNFGIKFWLAVDTTSKHLVNSFPYIGRDEERPAGVPLSEHVVMRLAEPYLSKGRSITCDNFFTGKSLGENSKRKSTMIVGTLEMSSREVPPSAKSPAMPLHSTIICKSGEMTLTSYQCTKNNNVLLLTTIHNTVTINERHQKKLPKTVMFL